MNSRSIFSLTETVIRRSKDVIKNTKRRITPQRKQLIFLFSGRTQYWTGMGHELYLKEPAFRSSIQRSNKVIGELGWPSILPNFEQTASDAFFDDEANILFSLIALQIAFVDLWKSKDIFPNAVLGISLGEITAGYVAGALSLKEVFYAAEAGVLLSRLEKNEFIVLLLTTGFSSAKRISEISPVPLYIMYEVGQNEVLAFCHKDEKETACNYLTNQQVGWHIPHEDCSYPYHTQLVRRHTEILSALTKKIQARPLVCDYYSSTRGKLFPRGSILEKEFWAKANYRPVLAHSALQCMGADRYEYMVYIGSHPFLKSQIIKSASSFKRQVTLLDSMRKGQPEVKLFEENYKKIQNIKFNPSPLRLSSENNDFFSQQLNLDAPFVIQEPHPYFKILRESGTVHFLPQHQAWLILDFNDIDYILKTPARFSSTIHKSFDEVLLGADPPDHTLIRSLLMPLFSASVLNILGEYTVLRTKELLNALIIPGTSCNVVESFSIPLTKSVTAKFLGLSSKEEALLDTCIKESIYGLGYFDALEQFCINYLEEHKASGTNAPVSKLLLSSVENGTLSFRNAARLMRTLWVAGMTTTSMLISSAILMLLKDSELAQKLRENEELIPRFIEECLRLETPESETRRITTQDVELGGKTIPAHSIVMLGLRAANRDPDYFENPDEISLCRPAKKHLSFGGGVHQCLGMGMARMEAKHVVKAILPRLPYMQLEEEAIVYFPSSHFRGLEKLSVTISEPNELIQNG